MKIEFTLSELSSPDSKILPGAFEQTEEKEIPVFYHFNPTMPLGKAKIRIKDDGIYGDVIIDHAILDLVAIYGLSFKTMISYEVLKKHNDLVTEARLTGVSLTSVPVTEEKEEKT